MSDQAVPRAAALLIEAHRTGQGFVSSAIEAPASADETYRVQNAVLHALAPGERVDAWKVSPPNPAYGITASPIPPQCLHAGMASLPAAPSGLLGVEVEIAFRFGRDLAERDAPYGDDEVYEALDAAVVAIELCATRLADWKDAAPLWRLADFQSNAALVVGSGVEAWRDIDFPGQTVQLWINGALRTEAQGSHPARDPSTLVPWLARHAIARRGALARGDVVTTGSWTGLTAVAAGDRVEARFPGVGQAVLNLAC